MRRSPIILLGLLLASASPLAAQALLGTLLDAGTRAALPEGLVTLLDRDSVVLAQVRTDTEGQFSLTVPRRGSYLLRAEHAGYRAATSPALGIGGDDTLTVEFMLAMDAVMLDPLVVTGRTRRLTPDGRAFYERADRSAWGTFITRKDIEKWHPIRTTDLFNRIPGVQTRTMMGGNSVTIRGTCRPTVYVNGIRANHYRSIDDLAQPMELEGVEVYRSASQAPPQFTGLMAGCAVVLLWTRIE